MKKDFGLAKKELSFLKSLNTPKKIQDFLEKLKTNFEDDTCFSPRTVLKKRKAHCMEAAMLAAAALRINGKKPLVVDLTTTNDDEDHVIAVFRQNKCWGAISKSNHSVLRYRDPIYRSIRELVMSYFNEYYKDNGKKTLRSYSDPVNLSRFDKLSWMASEKDVWQIPTYLAEVKHIPLLSRNQIAGLRKADKIEIKAGKIVRHRKRNFYKG